MGNSVLANAYILMSELINAWLMKAVPSLEWSIFNNSGNVEIYIWWMGQGFYYPNNSYEKNGWWAFNPVSQFILVL